MLILLRKNECERLKLPCNCDANGFAEVDYAAWHAAMKGKQEPKRLGDWVERLARPIAKLSDRWLGTQLAGCRACQRRKARLNGWHARLARGLKAIQKRFKRH
jgi:hypothetical protein